MNPKDINPTRVNSRAYPVAYPIAYPWLEVAIPAGVLWLHSFSLHHLAVMIGFYSSANDH